ncbi:hypothetical protein [Endozoicomonas atrinae]|uniref:hypothetical protein n=1 Tax=Endozoicomonas atrinae TaxID=1333660 RepID=UPI001112FBFF|nr:hypothetical protein [Endozoicomonas atrinae]
MFRRWMNPQWFELRAFLSNSLVQVVFTPVCALFLFGAFWQNPKLHQQVWGIAWLKVLLVVIYLPLSSLVVRKAGQWGRVITW